jgi:dolichol-phosphate mannosyltransferase
MNNAALLLRGPIVYFLTSGLQLHYLISNLISLVSLTILRYLIADRLIWQHPYRAARRVVYHYDIHGVVRVTSEGRLPELERFRVDRLVGTATIRVRIGDTTAETASGVSTKQHIHYDEGIGAFGFGIDVTKGETIEVVASPILQWSPHVLYTNVVEPILRWTFVEKGFALVHGACIAMGEHAYLVTARTDTGKTTTILRLLDQQRRASDQGAFLSDDLTLITPDGRVLTYPKPLTISQHTVAAIHSPLLSLSERLSLIIQSRLHSRDGRRFAFWLSQTNLPVATINTIVQWLVPPPKYPVQRLVPHVKLASEGQLNGMFVIERGGDGDVRLDEVEGLDILMRNCEDAYGFPPYPTIAKFLYDSTDRDLRAAERQIVAAALQGHATLLLRSSSMDWSSRIAKLASPQDLNREPVTLTPGGEPMRVLAPALQK